MSRNEGEEEEILFVWIVLLHLKACLLSRATLVREVISVCDTEVTGRTLQSDGARKEEWFTLLSFISECCEFRQVYSSVLSIITTSHDQFSWFIMLEMECIFTKSNGSQFGQIYSSFSFQAIHSQIPHENNYWMHRHQTEAISSWASLFIISFFDNHLSIPILESRINY